MALCIRLLQGPRGERSTPVGSLFRCPGSVLSLALLLSHTLRNPVCQVWASGAKFDGEFYEDKIHGTGLLRYEVPAPYTQHPTPYTLHPTPHTLHPTPYERRRNNLKSVTGFNLEAWARIWP